MSQNEHKFFGNHVFGEMYGIKFQQLNDLKYLETLLSQGIEESGATLCSIQSKVFEPSGITILALLSESHTSIHTYPDFGALFFDAFTCGDQCNPEKIAYNLIKALRPSKHNIQIIKRGEKLLSGKKIPLKKIETA